MDTPSARADASAATHAAEPVMWCAMLNRPIAAPAPRVAACAGPGAPGVAAARVNPRVEIGVNPDSHPWADALDGPGAAP